MQIQDLPLARERLRCPDFHQGLLAAAKEVVDVTLVRVEEGASVHELLQGLAACGLQHNTLALWDGVR